LTDYVSKLQILSFHGSKVTHQSFVVGMDAWMDGWMDGSNPSQSFVVRMNGWMDGWMDGWDIDQPLLPNHSLPGE
jgi:hypothetical protein